MGCSSCGKRGREQRGYPSDAALRASGAKLTAPIARPARPLPGLMCKHRGAEARRELCQTCTGRVFVRVYACGLGGECRIGKQNKCEREQI